VRAGGSGVTDRRTTDARNAFLAGLVDDAGLFPPARLPMAGAVDAHAASKEGPHGWMMGRFLCPASRLPELLEHLPERDGGAPWGIGVVMDGAAEDWEAGVEGDLAAARAFEERVAEGARVELLEARLPSALVDGSEPGSVAAEVRVLMDRASRVGPKGPAVPFFEIPLGPGWRKSLPAALEGIARVREAPPEGVCQAPGAKLRCGGLVAEAFPSPEQVAGFVAACARLGVPMKATAGLHHPFRHEDEETGFLHHGFVNVVGAAVLSLTHRPLGPDLVELVADEDPSDFSLTAEGFRWRSWEADAPAVARARRELFVAYGSCSFAEPVEDLEALGVLPVVV